MEKLIKFVKALIVVIAGAMLVLAVKDYIQDYRNAYNEEYAGTYHREGTDVIVYIPQNSSAKEVAKLLHDKGLIKFEGAFVKRLQESEYAGKMRAGTYTLNTGMNTLEMIRMISPDVDTSGPKLKLVVPEGFTVDMIAARCAEEGVCTKQEFLNAVNSVTTSDFSYLADVPNSANVRYKLEGYLFPATYDIYEGTTADQLVGMMIQAFKNYYTTELQDLAAERGLNSFQVLTLAAMVEREAKLDSERPKIAGVLNNRLNQNMLLQIDSTVLYPLTNGLYNKEVVTYDDLEVDSPYNTYKYSGMPVGPICNPGLACIKAVLQPEEHNYLYYHVINEETGEHIFTETLEEHEETMTED